jgi:hypothetical protein
VKRYLLVLEVPDAETTLLDRKGMDLVVVDLLLAAEFLLVKDDQSIL